MNLPAGPAIAGHGLRVIGLVPMFIAIIRDRTTSIDIVPYKEINQAATLETAASFRLAAHYLPVYNEATDESIMAARAVQVPVDPDARGSWTRDTTERGAVDLSSTTSSRTPSNFVSSAEQTRISQTPASSIVPNTHDHVPTASEHTFTSGTVTISRRTTAESWGSVVSEASNSGISVGSLYFQHVGGTAESSMNTIGFYDMPLSGHPVYPQSISISRSASPEDITPRFSIYPLGVRPKHNTWHVLVLSPCPLTTSPERLPSPGTPSPGTKRPLDSVQGSSKRRRLTDSE